MTIEYQKAEDAIPDIVSDEAFDALPESRVACVNVRAGDSATEQGHHDAAAIVALVNSAPDIIREIEELRALVRELLDALPARILYERDGGDWRRAALIGKARALLAETERGGVIG